MTSRLLFLFLVAAGALAAAPPSAEDAAARAALPEFLFIPPAPSSSLTPAVTTDPAVFNRWPRSHGDNGSRRYSALAQINRTNVRDLTVAWTYRSGDGAANIQCTPIVVDGVL